MLTNKFVNDSQRFGTLKVGLVFNDSLQLNWILISTVQLSFPGQQLVAIADPDTKDTTIPVGT